MTNFQWQITNVLLEAIFKLTASFTFSIYHLAFIIPVLRTGISSFGTQLILDKF